MYALFWILWVIFNGQLTLEIAIFGIFIAAAVFAFVCKFADHSMEKELNIYKNIFRGIRYILVLVWEIIKANFAVMHLILTQKEEVEPALVTFNTSLKTPTARAFLANAITLTPGTITVGLEDDKYVVHCLDKELAPGMDSSVFVEMLTDLEEKAKVTETAKPEEKTHE